MDTENPLSDSTSLATSRSRRSKSSKTVVGNALEKIRQSRLNGKKCSYMVEDSIENVYDYVSEAEYAKKVRSRVEEDWLVDDDGNYVEDGREIFDEEMDDKTHKGSTSLKTAEIKRNKSAGVARGNIKNLLLSMPTNKKRKADSDTSGASVPLQDELLDQILGEVAVKKFVVKRNKSTKFTPLPTNTNKMPGKETSVAIGENIFTGINRKQPVREFTTFHQQPINDSQHIENFSDEDSLTTNTAAIVEQKSNISASMEIDVFEDSQNIDFSEEMVVEDEKENESDRIKKLTSVSEEMKAGRGFQEELKKHNAYEPLSTWNDQTIGKSSQIDTTPFVEIQLSNDSLPLTTNSDGKKVLRMYWLDAHDDPIKHPGVVWLFGRIFIPSANVFLSCCVCVKNIPRKILLLKREINESEEKVEISIEDVYNEFDQKFAPKLGISEFRSKPVYKKYSFGLPGVPEEAEYLEVQYPARVGGALPDDTTGKTFSRVFGANQGFLEQFLLSRKIKGPTWLDISSVNVANPLISWCKVEAVCQSPECVSVCTNNVPPVPPVCVLTLNMKTTINVKTQQNEIAMISCLVHSAFHLDKGAPKPAHQMHFSALTRPSDQVWPFDFAKVLAKHASTGGTKIHKMESERELLGFVLAKIKNIDPDIIIGYDITGFDLDVLLHRMLLKKIPHWSKLGRLKRSQAFNGKGRFFERQAVTGRLICDLKLSAKELIRCKNYELPTLTEKILCDDGLKIDSILSVDNLEAAYNNSEAILNSVGASLAEAAATLRCICELNALPLALQITQIAGNVMSRTLLGGRAERNEFLLLHAFTERNFVVPDKMSALSMKKKLLVEEAVMDFEDKKGGKRKPAYAGGLVLDPKKGFYDKFILLMDFNSLYPSIIQEYNICFTTVNHYGSSTPGDVIPDFPDSNGNPGILPTEIRKLVESRRAVKNLLKDSNISDEQRMQYDVRQKALKLTANSMYGCLGFTYSRFYAKSLAAMITWKGREILMQTKDLVEKMNLEVIYGDTDSIMINSNSVNYETVVNLGFQIKTAVNKLYRLLELEVDGVYRFMLLLKKKKYAAVSIEKRPNGELVSTTEVKGLDIVRRDWSQLASDAGRDILNIILTDLPADERISQIHASLEALTQKVLEGKVSLSDLSITKQLTKDPEDYPDKKSLPHVQVAIRLNAKGGLGGKKLHAGDTVQYVICLDGTTRSAILRAYHVNEVSDPEYKDLSIDTNYYLTQQLHPVISRLCDVLDGTDSSRIAASLGLDPNQYRKHIGPSTDRTHHDADDETYLTDVDRFRNCQKLRIVCECGEKIVLDSILRGRGRDCILSLSRCTRAECEKIPIARINYLQNILNINIRSHINKYFAGWIICEDPGCCGRTRQLPLVFQQAFPVCSTCYKATMYPEYSDVQLYTQLLYTQHLFDINRALNKLSTGSAERDHIQAAIAENSAFVDSYARLKAVVDKFMSFNNYSIVSLSKIFEGLYPVNATRLRQRI